MLLVSVVIYAQPSQSPRTFCNPLNLSYRFMVDAVDAREAADPVIVVFKDDYYLFASRSGGYWWSSDMHDWTFVVPVGLTSIEGYAPALVVMRDTLYYTGSDGLIFKSADPKSGKWTLACTSKTYGDPALFLDDDGKLYMYYGLSNVNPLGMVELDPYTFSEIGTPVTLFGSQASSHGWERRGDDNLLDEQPWIEGSWMVKYNDKYYLHYSAPGTEFKTYADGIYLSDSPKGPFQYADYSPFSFKPTGFVCGAGHGCTFMDKTGNYWRIVTMTISVKHMFERRLGLFPVSFDADGHINCNTVLADYPQYLPGEKDNPGTDNRTGMMLLSRNKYITASSSLSNHGVNNAVDEEIRTYWSAQTGNADEWVMIDLGKECDIEAVQINLGEEGTTPELVRGRTNPVYEQYVLQVSGDGTHWDTLVDKSSNTQDVPHEYIELVQAVKARYVKLINVFTPGNGKFAVRDLRVFGNSGKAVFTDGTGSTVDRNSADGRDAVIRWSPVDSADGYIIRYGIAPDKLYNNYMVYDADSISIHSLNKNVEYYFSVQAFNNGTDNYVPTGEFKSYKSGNWNETDTWQRYDGTQWTHPAPGLPALTGGPTTICAGHTVTITANDSASKLTADSGSTLIVNPGVTFRVVDGIGTDFTVAATVRNNGIIEGGPSSTLSFVGGGTYVHDRDGGTIPSAEWRTGSTCRIEGVTANAPSNGNQNFYNVLWDCINQSGNLSLRWNNNTIGGTITIMNTGTGRWQMCEPSAGSPANVTLNGGVVQSGGVFTTNGTDNAGTSVTISQHGNIAVTGGDFSVSGGSQGGTGTAVWNLDGDMAISNATVHNSNPAGGKFVFTGTQTHSITLGEGNTITSLPIEVARGAALNLGTNELVGSGFFILDTGATVVSGHPDGINGNLKNTGTRTLYPETGYGFNGTAAQVTGDLMPDVIGNLIMDNTAGVTLSKSLTVNGMLEIKKSGLSVGGYTLVFGPDATLKYSGTTAMTTSNVEFPSTGGPNNVYIGNSSASGITLHAERTINGNLHLAGKFRLSNNNFTAATADREGTTGFVVTNGTGSLGITNVGTETVLFPLGISSYAPVWIINNGTIDDVSARVESASQSVPDGGRVRAKWSLREATAGGGNYTVTFGWMTQLEDAKFSQNRNANAGIFLFASDTTEAGTGGYTTQFDSLPYTISRGGITTLGSFGVGKFGDITVGVKNSEKVPTDFSVNQNYPNPFNPVTRITFSIPKDVHVSLKIFNVLGKEIAAIVDRDMKSGEYVYEWNASDFASGIYFYTISAGDFIQTKKMVLIK
jgi:xylan 1,4-beta-xylosidase